MSANDIIMGAAGTSGPASYIEDVFSTYLYTGSGSAQTITNNIDLSTKGGLTWIKYRTDGGANHIWTDTVRGATKTLNSNSTSAESTLTQYLTAFTTSGFSVGNNGNINDSGGAFASWTFCKQPKFFDVVTYTGNGGTNLISHNLGSAPGCVIVKKTSGTSDWGMWHRGNGGSTDDTGLSLNTTGAAALPDVGIAASFTSTTWPAGFVYTSAGANMNDGGATYVAYLFAHNAGGFGLTGTDNVISCGSFTTDGSGNATVSLGYEPQWLLIKSTTFGGWWLTDTMRGMSVASGDNVKALFANTSGAEANANEARPNATGFTVGPSGNLSSSDTFIYIAIRRGPMKVPTSGTSVFSPVLNTGTGANITLSSGGFAPDMLWNKSRSNAYGTETWDKLRGVRAVGLTTSSTGAEGLSPAGSDLVSFNNTGVTEGANSGSVMNISGWTYVNWMFGRAPNFFDEVCYTGTGGASQTFTHNLSVAPELVIVKNRDAAAAWESLGTALSASQRQLYLNRTQAGVAVAAGHLGWNGTDGAYKAPTSSVVYFGGDSDVGGSGVKYVAYLFATCAGVSKVGSYTGNGTTQTINCGFTGGARFVLIKRTDSTGDWYTYDTARGMTVLTDPYLLLNTTAAESATLGSVTTVSTGFALNSTILAAINASGGTYIFLAIA